MQKTSHNFSLAISGIVTIFGLFALTILFSEVQNTGLLVNKLAVKDASLPYSEGRTLRGIKTTPEGVPVSDELMAYLNGVPFRSYSRVPYEIPTLYTSCGEKIMESTLRIKNNIESTVHKNSTCPYVPELQEYCCPVPELPGAIHVP